MVCRTHRGEEEEEEGGGSRGWRSTGIRAGRERGGTRWVREREGYHIFTGISSFKIFIRRSLALYLFSAPPSRRRSLWSSAVWSDILCLGVCVCVCVCLWSCECECVCVCVWLWVTVWDRASKACMSKYVRMLAPDYPLSLLITTLCHTSRFYQSPHRTLPSSPLPSFSLFPLRFPSPHPPPPPPPPSLSSEEQTPVLHQRTRDFNARTNNLPRLLGLSLAAVTPGQACWFDHLFLSVNRACLTLIV